MVGVNRIRAKASPINAKSCVVVNFIVNNAGGRVSGSICINTNIVVMDLAVLDDGVGGGGYRAGT